MPSGRRPLIWSPEARHDLADIWSYYVGTAGRQTADDIIRKIGQACVVIEEFPLGGRARNELRPGLRSLAVTPHIVFYRVASDGPEVVRVLDGRRDLDELFAEDPARR
jgi:toxin ParE1/3/4